MRIIFGAAPRRGQPIAHPAARLAKGHHEPEGFSESSIRLAGDVERGFKREYRRDRRANRPPVSRVFPSGESREGESQSGVAPADKKYLRWFKKKLVDKVRACSRIFFPERR